VPAADLPRQTVVAIDPLYSTHDQDENDTRAMAALCQSLLRLREASRAALIMTLTEGVMGGVSEPSGQCKSYRIYP
jgi:hypothetical protein